MSLWGAGRWFHALRCLRVISPRPVIPLDGVSPQIISRRPAVTSKWLPEISPNGDSFNRQNIFPFPERKKIRGGPWHHSLPDRPQCTWPRVCVCVCVWVCVSVRGNYYISPKTKRRDLIKPQLAGQRTVASPFADNTPASCGDRCGGTPTIPPQSAGRCFSLSAQGGCGGGAEGVGPLLCAAAEAIVLSLPMILISQNELTCIGI